MHATIIYRLIIPALILTGMLASCGPETPRDGSAATIEMGQDGIRTVTITPEGNQMRFAQTEIRAIAGEQLRVILDNIATSPAMHHNVLFVTNREAIEPVGRAAMNAADRDYIPDHPAVLGSTPMAAPGQRVEVLLSVPTEPGEYPFICTYPGHYMLMQGSLMVE